MRPYYQHAGITIYEIAAKRMSQEVLPLSVQKADAEDQIDLPELRN